MSNMPTNTSDNEMIEKCLASITLSGLTTIMMAG